MNPLISLDKLCSWTACAVYVTSVIEVLYVRAKIEHDGVQYLENSGQYQQCSRIVSFLVT